MEIYTHPQVGDIVQNILSGDRMTIIHITLDPEVSQHSYRCAWFSNEHHLKEEWLLQKDFKVMHSSNGRDTEMSIKNKVCLKHQDFSQGPVMEIIDIVDDEGSQSAICTWQTIDKATDVDILPLTALKKARQKE